MLNLEGEPVVSRSCATRKEILWHSVAQFPLFPYSVIPLFHPGRSA